MALIAALLMSARVSAKPAATSVVVVDTAGHPIAGAQILTASAPIRRLGVTGRDGSALVQAAAGTKVIAVLEGDRSAEAALNDTTTTLRLLPVIAAVHVRSSSGAAAPVRSVSKQALILGGLRAAMRLNPRFRSSAEGGSDEEEVNGIPLPLPASSSQSGESFRAALFDSVSPDAADGSSIPDFHLVNPTAHPEQTLSLTGASYDDVQFKATAAGRRGRAGYGASFLQENDNGQLAHQIFRDAGGTAYDHSSNERQRGGTFNLLYDLGPTQLSFSAVADNRTGRDIANVDPGKLPLGFGPNARSNSSDATAWITVGQSMGRDQLLYVGVHYNGAAATLHGGTQFLGRPAGYETSFAYAGSYQLLKITRSFKNLAVYAQAVDQGFDFHNAGFASATASTSSVRSLELGSERSGAHLSYGANGGLTTSSGQLGASTADFQAHARYTIGNIVAALSVAQEQSQTNESYGVGDQSLSSPYSANYNCTARSAQVFAPSIIDGRHPQKRLLDGSVQWSRAASSVTIGGFVSSETNAIVEDVAAQPLIAAPGYAATIAQLYDGICPGSTLDTLYADRYVQLPLVRSREFYLAGQRGVGSLTISGFYEVLARFATDDAPNSQSSSIIAYAQLPHVPRNRANVLITAPLGKAGFAGIDALYTSANNEAALPGHIDLTIGAAVHAGSGTIACSFENPFNAYGGSFISPRYAVPIPTSSGAFLPLATPLTHTWSVRYLFSRPAVPPSS